MRYATGMLIALLFVVSSAFAESGLVNVRSTKDVKTTADSFEAAVKEKGMSVFSRIDHAAAATKVNEKLRPTELIIFGSPAVGTKLMLCGQSIGIDLPLKALIWQDEKGTVWVSYNDPKYLAQRHAITGCDEVVKKVTGVLNGLASAASAP